MKSSPEVLSFTLNTISGTTNLTEADLARIAPPSAEEWREALGILKIPENSIKGIKILDVGGGASENTSRFLKMGADAYSIDPLYKSRSDIIGKVRQALKSTSHYDHDQRRNKLISLENFSTSIRDNPERYKTAYATNMPFPDNFFDIVFSINTVMPYLDVDRRILTKVTEECLRVLKPGGQLQFFPYDEAFNDIWPTLADDQRRRNDKFLLEWVKRSNVVSNATAVKMKEGPNAREKLVIIKTEIPQIPKANSL